MCRNDMNICGHHIRICDAISPRAYRNSKARLSIAKLKMVGVARIELATPAMSTQCSTTELHAHTAMPLAGCARVCKPLN